MEISYAPNNAEKRERGKIYLNSEEGHSELSEQNAERSPLFLKGHTGCAKFSAGHRHAQARRERQWSNADIRTTPGLPPLLP
jgi:hypothetical protein